MRAKLLGFLLLCSLTVDAQTVLPPDSSGLKLRSFYQGLRVESLWLPGHHINWETGQPDDPNATTEIKTHCSAFAAAAAYKQDIYMLRPPQHSQELLSNAQYKWFKTTAAKDAGWLPITGSKVFADAQNLANKGFMVTAVFGSADASKPGHIALVMPQAIPVDSVLANNGPRIIMAGQVNYTNTTLRWGFRYHVTQWPENVIMFYYNRKKLF